jgi:L-threonine kinase
VPGMEGVAYYPGSFGEIVQGNFNGRDLLVSCPINLFTKVRVFETKVPKEKLKHTKSRRLLENLLRLWGFEKYIDYFDIEINSDIPRGKGFASSTADLCGVYYSLIKIFNREFKQDELINECVKIEPTDSIIFKKMTFFDYKSGSYFETIGDYMEFYMLCFEGQRIVDTVQFNNLDIPTLQDISFLSELFKEGVQKRDVKKIAYASTVSITRNLCRLNYEVLPEIKSIKEKTGGLGIIGAHSGDALGIIYDDYDGIKKGLEYGNLIKGYKCYPLKTLRSVEYEDRYDYSTK